MNYIVDLPECLVQFPQLFRIVHLSTILHFSQIVIIINQKFLKVNKSTNALMYSWKIILKMYI